MIKLELQTSVTKTNNHIVQAKFYENTEGRLMTFYDLKNYHKTHQNPRLLETN